MSTSSIPIFYLHVQSQGCAAEIRLNDAPMLTVAVEHKETGRPTVSQWVINGENLLSVHVHELGDAPRVRVALCRAMLGDVPEEGQETELIVIEWPPVPLPAAPPVGGELPIPIELPGLPLVLTKAGAVAHAWGVWAWETAPVFAADTRATAALIAYIRDLHATLAVGSVATLLAHSQIKFSEVAPIYGSTPAALSQRLERVWPAMTGQTEWELASFDELDLDLRLHCGGRLVEPTTRDGQPILRQARAINRERWSLPIFIARTHRDYTDGYLAIVR
jgi:hypothetical protein